MQYIEREFSHVSESSRQQQTAFFALYEGLIILGRSDSISWHTILFQPYPQPAELGLFGPVQGLEFRAHF